MDTAAKKHIFQARSEEVQQILSRPPAWIIRWGTGIAFVFMGMLLSVAWLVPSQTVISVKVKLSKNAPQHIITPVSGSDSEFVAVARVSQNNFGKIKTGQKVSVKLDAYDYREFGIIQGIVTAVSQNFDERTGQFDIVVSVPQNRTTSKQQAVQYKNAMSGSADILIAEKRLIEKLSPF